MKKLILLLVIVISTTSIKAQEQISKVVEVELTKKEIHQKINEWIAINYKSANDVIQLNTEDKIIIKGNYKVVMNRNVFRIHNSLTFSLRDNKYKMDLSINNVSTTAFKMGDSQHRKVIEAYAPKTHNKEEYVKISKDRLVTYYKSVGWSDKKIDKKVISKPFDEDNEIYNVYLVNKTNWDTAISSTLQSIEDYVSNSNDGW